jgi:hypothetical protein
MQNTGSREQGTAPRDAEAEVPGEEPRVITSFAV